MTNDLTLLRPFDAEAAKRGEPICYHQENVGYEFIAGPDSRGGGVLRPQ